MADIAGAKLAELPAIVEAPPTDRARLLRQKLRLCCQVYTFESVKGRSNYSREKEAKKATLIELRDYISGGKHEIPGVLIFEILNTVTCNIFRPLGRKAPNSSENQDTNDSEDSEETHLEAAWPHLNLVYELLLRLVVSKQVDSKTAREYFSKSFILNFLNLFDSEDPRERDYLKVRRGDE